MSRVIKVGLLSLIFALSWLIQNQLLLNWDESWLLHAADLMRHGKHYGSDFFETNPPLILYLYLPPLLLHDYLPLSLIVLLRGYLFLLVALSLYLFATVNKLVFKLSDTKLATSFFYLMTVILLFVPSYEFGQRDFLYFLFTLPYLFLLQCRLQAISIPKNKIAMIGFLAALGFALKPFFLLVLMVLETYRFFYQGNWRQCLRLENTIILLFCVLYSVSVYWWQNDYFTQVMPLTQRYYYSSFSFSFFTLFFYPLALYCLLPIMLLAVSWRLNRYHLLSCTLLIALLANFGLVYIMQRTNFYYHLVPALSCALMLSSLLFLQLLQLQFTSGFAVDYSLIVLVLLQSVYLFVGENQLQWVFQPTYGQTFVGLMFLTLLMTKYLNRKLFKINSLLMSLLLVCSLWLFPSLAIQNIHAALLTYKQQVTPMIDYLHNKAQGQPVYIAAFTTIFSFPIVDYAKVDYVSKYNFLWLYTGIQLKLKNAAAKDKQFYENDLTQLAKTMVNELQINKPKLILLQQQAYLNLLQRDTRFANIWQHYQQRETFVMPASNYGNLGYQFLIFERKDT